MIVILRCTVCVWIRRGKRIYVSHDKEKAEKHRQYLIERVGHAFMYPEKHYRVVEYILKGE